MGSLRVKHDHFPTVKSQTHITDRVLFSFSLVTLLLSAGLMHEKPTLAGHHDRSFKWGHGNDSVRKQVGEALSNSAPSSRSNKMPINSNNI